MLRKKNQNNLYIIAYKLNKIYRKYLEPYTYCIYIKYSIQKISKNKIIYCTEYEGRKSIVNKIILFCCCLFLMFPCF